MSELIKRLLLKHWDSKSPKIDWAAFEDTLDQILRSEMADEDKVRASKECLDAFTRRGHFSPSEYLS